ncbi:MAG: hypothetical protein NTU74_17355, partial [Deltaproteobacteria bacterium]|nr:hypothetical protein [Deltaproteobacteria bacterium]
KNVAVNDRIILDTGDGAAICFLGDPEDALFVAMSLRDAVLSDADQFTDDPLLVRFGINLGPVKLVNDINNQKNIIGDGINTGQRIMSFAEPGQILVSRSYFEVVSCLTQEYAKLFHYLGMRADKHIRKHELYSILRTSEQAKAISSAESSKQDDAHIPARNVFTVEEIRIAPRDSAFTLGQNPKNDISISSSASFKHLHWWQTKKFVHGCVAVSIVLWVILSFVIYWNFGGGKVQPDKIALSPAAQLKIPDESPPENTQSSENVSPEQTESAQPPPPVSNIILQQESPDESPQESAHSKENVDPDQTLQPHQTPSDPNAIIQFAITPWGDVFLDGKIQGASPPLTSLSIAPGKHIIEIINTAFPAFSQTFEIAPNEKLKFSHKFK